MSLSQAFATQLATHAGILLGLASILSGMFIGLAFGSVCWYFMKQADRAAKLSLLWLFLVWGALWLGQGLQEPIERLVRG